MRPGTKKKKLTESPAASAAEARAVVPRRRSASPSARTASWTTVGRGAARCGAQLHIADQRPWSAPDCGISGSLLGNNRDCAVALQHGVLDLVETSQSLRLTRCLEDVPLIDACPVHPVFERVSVHDDQHRHVVDQPI